MKRKIIVEIISYLFALLFLYTGLMKLTDQHLFRLALAKSPLLHRFTPILAIGVPLVELLVATSLLLPRFRQLGLYSSLILMGLFALYVGYMVYFMPHELPCSCGGIIQEMTWHQHFYFNSLFTFLSLFALWLGRKQKQQAERGNSISYT